MNSTFANNFYYPSQDRQSQMSDLSVFSEGEKKIIYKKFNKIKVISDEHSNKFRILPLNVNLQSESIDNKRIRIIVDIRNLTDDNWFIPSPYQYFGNKYLTIKSDKDVIFFPNKKYTAKPGTGDTTMWGVYKENHFKIIYTLNYDQLCLNKMVDIYVDLKFLPSFIAQEIDEVVRARIISSNYLRLNCETMKVESFPLH